MQRIIIENFGPIQHLDLEIKDLSLFIGEQATGKSTVAKLIYFFKSLRDELELYLYDRTPIADNLIEDFVYNKIHATFNVMFSAFKPNTQNFNIIFKYTDTRFIQVQTRIQNTLGVSIVNTEGEGQDSTEMKEICRDIEKFRDQYFSKETVLVDSSEKQKNKFDQLLDLQRIKKRIDDFFSYDGEILFTPANRSLLAIFPDHLQAIYSNDFDSLTAAFLRRIATLKPALNQPLKELIKELSFSKKNIPNQKVIQLSLEKIELVLKGEYRIGNSGEERIYFDEKSYIKLSMASSGQQEAVWILMQIFLLLLNREKVFLVIEEPEAHLSPEAQKSVVELITLLLKENGSQVLITTHSPYILTAFNNLIYAGNVGKEHPEEVGKIIPPQLWIDSEQVGAYKLRAGTSEDLMDRETKLIRAEELDSVSQSINQAFDAILNLELQ
ncbi:MAG: ATP-binding protein [Saprospiraceae bacterium]|nr:ATP-binding protein [Saprospiraceae bacterium]